MDFCPERLLTKIIFLIKFFNKDFLYQILYIFSGRLLKISEYFFTEISVLTSIILDEAIFCFIKKFEFHQLSLTKKVEFIRRHWFSIFLIELAMSEDINIQFDEIPIDDIGSGNTLPTKKCAFKLANFISL